MRTKILWLGASLLIATGLMACETDKASPDTKVKTPDVADKADKPVAKPAAKPTDKKGDKKAADTKPAAAVKCQKDKGCPAQEKLETCPLDLETQPFIAGLDKRNPIKSGTKVALVGPLLRDAACTERGCDLPCCNTCSGTVKMGASLSEALVFVDEKAPKRFQITGDETMTCSPFPDTEVVVRGEFAIIKGEYGVKNPTFCKPR